MKMTDIQKQLVRNLLVETITTLCRNSLKYDLELSVDGLLGITLDRDQVFLVKVNETVHPDPRWKMSEMDREENRHKSSSRSSHTGHDQSQIPSTTDHRASAGQDSSPQRRKPDSTASDVRLETTKASTRNPEGRMHSAASQVKSDKTESVDWDTEQDVENDTLTVVKHEIASDDELQITGVEQTSVNQAYERVRPASASQVQHLSAQPNQLVYTTENTAQFQSEHQEAYSLYPVGLWGTNTQPCATLTATQAEQNSMATGSPVTEPITRQGPVPSTSMSTDDSTSGVPPGVSVFQSSTVTGLQYTLASPNAVSNFEPAETMTHRKGLAPGTSGHSQDRQQKAMSFIVSSYTESIKVCPLCDRNFPSTKLLAKHLMLHKTDSPTGSHCPICRLSVKYRANMHVHIRTQHLGQRYICIICGAAHTRHNTAMRHVLKAHKNLDIKGENVQQI